MSNHDMTDRADEFFLGLASPDDVGEVAAAVGMHRLVRDQLDEAQEARRNLHQEVQHERLEAMRSHVRVAELAADKVRLEQEVAALQAQVEDLRRARLLDRQRRRELHLFVRHYAAMAMVPQAEVDEVLVEASRR